MKNKFLIVKVMACIMTLFLIKSCYYDTNLPDTGEIIDPGVQISFAGDLVPIFNSDCNSSGCHAPGDKAPDLSEGNAYNSLTSGNYINTANPESSELYQWMRGNRDLPMPLTGPNAEYNAKVLTWITQGALNN